MEEKGLNITEIIEASKNNQPKLEGKPKENIRMSTDNSSQVQKALVSKDTEKVLKHSTGQGQPTVRRTTVSPTDIPYREQNNTAEQDKMGKTLEQLLGTMHQVSKSLNNADTWLLLMMLKVETIQGIYVTFHEYEKKEIADEWLTKLQSVTKTVNVALKRDRFSKNVPTSLVVKVNEVMNLIENTLNTCEKSLETKYNNDLGSYIDLFR